MLGTVEIHQPPLIRLHAARPIVAGFVVLGSGFDQAPRIGRVQCGQRDDFMPRRAAPSGNSLPQHVGVASA